MDCGIVATLKLRCTVVAALKVEFPGCDALTVTACAK
jgi:hypothetical protein